MTVAKLNKRLSDELVRLGFDKPIPKDERQWWRYLSELREVLNMTQHEFWPLFTVNPHTGSKYEAAPDRAQRRTCPQAVMYTVGTVLGLKWEVASFKAQTLPTEDANNLRLLYDNNVTHQELQMLIEILAVIRMAK